MTRGERAYYQQRAPEYDDFYLGTGLFAARERPGWHQELEALQSLVSSIRAEAVLDVACGTGFLTRHLRGRVMGVDQSRAMLNIARSRLRRGAVAQADAFCLPFRSGAFDCLVAGHFYGHLPEPERARFLVEARRVAARLLIIDAALRDGVAPEQVQQRVLNDGSQHAVYKRYFTAEQLARELGSGAVLYGGQWFVAVMA